MKKDAVLKKCPDMVSRQIDDQAMLIPIYRTSQEANYIYTLNKVALKVWDLIDGKRTLKDIKKVILKNFDTTEEEADKKLQVLLEDLRKIKAIEEV
jgi:hypothetical protein